MIARVESIANSHAWAKGGVMIRQTIEPGSNHAFMAITPGGASAGNGASFQHRLVAGGTATNNDSASLVAAPYWVKVERNGNSFTGFVSPDGKTWTQVGVAQTISMTGSALIGLALCSHNATMATGAEFSGISFSGSVTGSWQVAEIGSLKPGQLDGRSVSHGPGHRRQVQTVIHPDAMATARPAEPVEDPAERVHFGRREDQRDQVDGDRVGNKTGPTPGGTGLIFIDDIGYAARCRS
jgi:hypothetical protein